MEGTDAIAVGKTSKSNTEPKQLRLQIVLLFKDKIDWDKYNLQTSGASNAITSAIASAIASSEASDEASDDASADASADVSAIAEAIKLMQVTELLESDKFEIKGITPNDNEEIVKYLFPIAENIDKNKFSLFQNTIKETIENKKSSYKGKVILDILCPFANHSVGPKDVYLTFLFDRSFSAKMRNLIDVKNSTISILFPKPEQKKKSGDLEQKKKSGDLEQKKKSGDDINKPTNIDAKIAALMSHYVYFYLDWLEYVHAHIHGLKKYSKYKFNKNNNDDDLSDIIEEFDILNERTGLFKTGILAFGGKEKVKFRVINRLREIAKAVNYSDEVWIDENDKKILTKFINRSNTNKEEAKKVRIDTENNFYNKIIGALPNVLNKDESLIKRFICQGLIPFEEANTNSIADAALNQFQKFLNDICSIYIYVDILYDCKKNGRPVGFYDLYNCFGYWSYINDADLTKEAKQWHVSHPYIVYDYESLKNLLKEESKPDENKLWRIKRKTNELFIAFEESGNKGGAGSSAKKDNDAQKNNSNNRSKPVGSQSDKRWLVYNTVLTQGLDQLSGYGGLLFAKIQEEDNKPKAIKFAYCTKGTDANSFNDWVFADVLQGVSGFSLQHLRNIKNAITINKKVEEYGKEVPLFYCGHSLGGGLASACAIASKGRHAITFNAAGLNFLGVVATRTSGGFNYGWNVPEMVHPIRIDGEAIDLLMLISFGLLANLNERAYGQTELILKLKGRGLSSFLLDVSESGAKHGINNFLYKPLMDALEIVDEKTIKYPVEDVNLKNTSVATLGSDNFRLVKKTNGMVIDKGNYEVVFTRCDEKGQHTDVFTSYIKCSYEDVLKQFSNINIKGIHPSMEISVEEYLKKEYDFKFPKN